MKRNVLLIITALWLLTSCDEIELEKTDPDVPVVEAYLQPGEQPEVRIFRQLIYAADDTGSYALDSLDVRMFNGQQWYRLNNTGNGYYTHPDIDIVAGNEFRIEFEYNEKMVTAQTNIPHKPTDFTTSETIIEAFTFDFGSGGIPERPDPVTFEWTNPDNSYHLVVIENIEDDPMLINEDLEDLPARVFRNAPVQGNSTELNPMTLTYYGYYRVILYKLNTEYAVLYEQLETNSLDITAPPSNVTNGLGIFTGINSDTLLIKVVD